jgi:hypothetical protein
MVGGAPARAQTSNGTIAGSVVDATGAGVAKATVKIVGAHTGATKTTTTNGVGGFRLESVLLDTYTVTAEAPGFSKRAITNVVVTASVITSVNPVLVSGSVTETVEVQAASELLQTDSGEISAAMGTQAVENLPIGSLSPYELATTLPGVSQPPGEYLDVGGMPNGFQFSVDGSRPRANNFLIEGQDNNDQGLHGQGLQPENLEAYNDITFLLNSYSAEYGHGGGSVSNLILKSGTNSFHGAVWDRLSNSSLDALDKGDLLNGSTTKSKYRENIAGFSIGGPVLKDKMFFFASYQFDHYRATANLNPIIVPTAAGVTTLQALGTNPRVANYLQAVGTLRGQSGAAYTSNLQLAETNPVTSTPYVVQVGPYRRNLSSATDSSELDIKGDYIVSPGDTLQLHYIRSPSLVPTDPNTAMLPGFDTNQNGVADNAGIAETHTFSPSLLNEFRFSYGRIGFTFGLTPATLANPLASGPETNIGIETGIVPGTTGEVTGFGSRTDFPQGRFHNTYEIQETMTWSKGKHTLRAGFDLPTVQVRDQIPFNYFGALSYAATASPQYTALANYVDDFGGDSGSAAENFGSPYARPVFHYQNYFAEDDWKFSSNLTLELGLRYEFAGTPFNNIKYLGVTPASVTNYLSAVPEQADTDDWAPRFGFAYTPGFLGEKKTVIRGGFGIFYDGLFTNIDDNILDSAPNAASPEVISLATSGSPRGTSGLSGRLAGLSHTAGATDFAEYITPEMASPRTLQWNLNVERELPFSFTGQVGYVGTRGEHLYATTEFNPYVNDIYSGTRIFNGRGRVVREDNSGDSIYHALQAQLTRKYRNGFAFRGAYTFSRMEDDVSEVFTEGQFSTFPVIQYPSARKTTDYGLSAFDHRQRLVFSYIYDFPKWGDAPKGLGEVVNGWQISGVSQFQSGQPANVEIGYDWNGDGIGNDRPDVGNPKAPLASFAVRGDDPVVGFGLGPGSYCDGPSWLNTGNNCIPVTLSSVRWVLPYFGTNGPGTPVGRNNLILRGFEQWDVSAQKSFHTYKEQSFDFRAEMFDVFNHGDTGTPNLNFFTGFAGVSNGDPLNTFGNYYPTVTGHRSIRLYLRYAF